MHDHRQSAQSTLSMHGRFDDGIPERDPACEADAIEARILAEQSRLSSLTSSPPWHSQLVECLDEPTIGVIPIADAANRLGAAPHDLRAAIQCGFRFHRQRWVLAGKEWPSHERCRAIICVDTNQRWESITIAANAMRIPCTTLRRALRKGRICRGHQFRFVDGKVAPDPSPDRRHKPVVCVESGERWESIGHAVAAHRIPRSSLEKAMQTGNTCRGRHYRHDQSAQRVQDQTRAA